MIFHLMFACVKRLSTFLNTVLQFQCRDKASWSRRILVSPVAASFGDLDGELWSELGDGADQAARLAGVADSATPSVNLTPAMTLGN